jgi:hypothetical protein
MARNAEYLFEGRSLPQYQALASVFLELPSLLAPLDALHEEELLDLGDLSS